MNEKEQVLVNLVKFKVENSEAVCKFNVFGVWICQTKLERGIARGYHTQNVSKIGLAFSHIFLVFVNL